MPIVTEIEKRILTCSFPSLLQVTAVAAFEMFSIFRIQKGFTSQAHSTHFSVCGLYRGHGTKKGSLAIEANQRRIICGNGFCLQL